MQRDPLTRFGRIAPSVFAQDGNKKN